MLNLKASLLLVASLLVLGGLDATAKDNKKDNKTPAQEKVCDVVKGATPGLYGMCVAYCEAQDANEFINLKTSSKKLLRNYDKKRKASDPQMPCVNYATACPVWASDQLGDIGTHGNDTIILEVVDNENGDSYDYEYGADLTVYASVSKNKDTGAMAGGFSHESPSDPSLNTAQKFELTAAEYDACKAELESNKLY